MVSSLIDVHRHFRRPVEAPFTAADRDHVTILFGGLTWKHELMIQAVLQNNGYKCERLPTPDRDAHEIGKEYCSNGLCNPVYFTVGCLIRFLRGLEDSGMSRTDIVRNYVFFTAGSNGPCRFGMYEAEFRSALEEAGFAGFRVLLFQQDHGVHATSGQSGLQFSVDFGMNALHAFVLGDLLNDLHRKLRPYEAHPGEVDRFVSSVAVGVAACLRDSKSFELSHLVPEPIGSFLARRRSSRAYRWVNTTGKVLDHMFGKRLPAALAECLKPLTEIEVDWLRVRPVVKVVGEFWAQQTEGDGNYNMFEFLEKEGAEVAVEPLSNWVMYLLNQAKRRAAMHRKVLVHSSRTWNPAKSVGRWITHHGKRAVLSAGESAYMRHYSRLARALGGISRPLPFQGELAAMADPHYCSGLRGGEGHLEVAKNLYYSANNMCHMVLALKPFGCLPSQQSDAVQAGLCDRVPEMLFLSVETSAEGSVHAYSRVQMALAEARVKAQKEFAAVLLETHKSLDEIREFVSQHAELRSPLYRVTNRPGVVSTAANFVLDVHTLMESSGDRGSSYKSDARRRSMRIGTVATNQEI